MDLDDLYARCAVTECDLGAGGEAGPDGLSVVVVYDQPFDALALDEALFSLAAQDYEDIEVVVVHPAAGSDCARRVEAAVRGQPWPAAARGRAVAVPTRSERAVSADLLNAGLRFATGRYVAFLHHQDVVYQHAYPALIGRLRDTDHAIAFGGLRVATHTTTHRHWSVAGKQPVPAGTRAGIALDGRGAIHSFVADRDRLPADELAAGPPGSRHAATLWLLRLALHPQADFALADTRVVEARVPPTPAGRLTPAADLLADLAGGHVRLLDPAAIAAGPLLADLVRAVAAR